MSINNFQQTEKGFEVEFEKFLNEIKQNPNKQFDFFEDSFQSREATTDLELQKINKILIQDGIIKNTINKNDNKTLIHLLAQHLENEKKQEKKIQELENQIKKLKETVSQNEKSKDELSEKLNQLSRKQNSIEMKTKKLFDQSEIEINQLKTECIFQNIKLPKESGTKSKENNKINIKKSIEKASQMINQLSTNQSQFLQESKTLSNEINKNIFENQSEQVGNQDQEFNRLKKNLVLYQKIIEEQQKSKSKNGNFGEFLRTTNQELEVNSLFKENEKMYNDERITFEKMITEYEMQKETEEIKKIELKIQEQITNSTTNLKNQKFDHFLKDSNLIKKEQLENYFDQESSPFLQKTKKRIQGMEIETNKENVLILEK
ncbi:hypothetical protein M0812_02647 [Anaeramoeba flamelloides]|uniref:Uncharacterized protein n=1 Tax=Anaeramoeba flamelloides TaxID=1746091 RepID=A0AAV7YQK2_9EUKA|nr:hypothetical protein M0812_02647 [Anaeramoeba flamelloides]